METLSMSQSHMKLAEERQGFQSGAHKSGESQDPSPASTLVRGGSQAKVCIVYILVVENSLDSGL